MISQFRCHLINYLYNRAYPSEVPDVYTHIMLTTRAYGYDFEMDQPCCET